MADEIVKIKIAFDAKTKELVRARLELLALDKAAKKLGARDLGATMAKSSLNFQTTSKKWKKSFDMIDSMVKMTGKGMTKFLGLAIKGVLIEMAGLAAAMLVTHALFASGRFLVKAYHGAMQLVAGGAAAMTMALGAAAAAMREQQAAMYAYRGKGAAGVGSSMNQTRMAMRNLHADAGLAVLGVEGLNKAFAVMSKSMNSQQINASNKSLKALMDFGSAGQDPQQTIEQVAAVVAALNNQKKSLADVKAEAGKLGPEMQKALKDTKFKQTKEGFKEALLSGLFAEKGGVAGQFAQINNTLIGQLKSYMTLLKTEFADFGDQFLEPTKGAFEEIFVILKRDLAKISAVIQQTMGFDGVTNGMVTVVDKLSSWMVKTMREFLPKASGMFKKMSEWMNDTSQAWKRMVDYLRPLQDGARVLEKALKPVGSALKAGASNLWLFNDLLQKNEGEVTKFGEALGGMITKGSELFMNLKKGFFDLLPFLTKIMNMVAQIFGMMSTMLTGGMGKGLMTTLAPLLAFSLAGRAMGKVTGKMAPEARRLTTSQMNVTAGTVSIGGTPVSGPGGSRPGGASRGPVGPGGKGTAVYPSLSSGAKIGTPATTAAGSPYMIGAQRNTAFMGQRGIAGIAPTGHVTDMGYDARRSSFNVGNRAGSDAYDQKSLSAFRGGGAVTLDPFSRYTAGSAAGMGKALHMDGAAASWYDERKAQRTTNAANRQHNANLAGMTPEMRAQAEGLGLGTRAVRGSAFKDQNQAMIDSASKTGLKGYGAAQGVMGYLSGGRYDPNMASKGLTYNSDGTVKTEQVKVGGTKKKPIYETRNVMGDTIGGTVDVASSRQQAIATYKNSQLSIAEGGTGRTGKMQRRAEKLRLARAQNRISRNETKFGAASNKFGKSMGGKMGASMGLGLMSQYAPEEMQGAMALGGVVSQFDARAGLAVAGLGGAMNADGAGAGLMAGAAGGAALGSYLGPHGALAGAVIGGLAGAFKGMINAGKYEAKRAKDAMKNNMAEVFKSVVKVGAGNFFRSQDKLQAIQDAGGNASSMTDRGSFEGVGAGYLKKAAGIKAMVTGNIQGIEGQGLTTKQIAANKALLEQVLNEQEKMGVVTTEKERKDMFKNSNATRAALGEAGNVSKGETSAYQMQDRVITNRLDQFVKMSGKSIPELEEMAHQLGFNLYDTTIKFTDALKGMGMAAMKTSQEMKNVFTDIFLDSSNAFRKKREAKEAQRAITSSSQGFADQMEFGGLDKEGKTAATDEYFENYFAQSLNAAGGDPIEAFLTTQNLFGKGAEGGAFAKGATFEGMGADVLSNETLKQQLADQKTQILSAATTQVSSGLTGAGFAGDAKQISGQLTSMSQNDPAKFAEFLRKMQSGSLDFQPGEGQGIESVLKGMGLSGVTATGIENLTGDKGPKDLDEVADRMANASVDFKKAVEQFTSSTGDFFSGKTDKPTWWDEKPSWYKDTSTPRGDTTSSRLSQTMARHGDMNSQLTGKRTVTSAWRNHSLGSINSDHVTGKAYDLTGQNLGQYQRLVHANGGFAEFHGTLADRHLHVVPGSGYGDSSVPSMSKVSSNGSSGKTSSNSMNVTLNVSGGTSSPEQIANIVMMKLNDAQRKMSERR